MTLAEAEARGMSEAEWMRFEVDRLTYQRAVSPEAAVRRAEMLERCRRELARLEREETA